MHVYLELEQGQYDLFHMKSLG